MKSLGSCESKEALDQLFDGYGLGYVVVRVSPFLLGELLGKEYETTDEGGRRIVASMQSVSLYWSDEHGLEAEPVFNQRLADAQS